MDASCKHDEALVSGRHHFVDVVLEIGRCRSCRTPLTRIPGGAWQELLATDPPKSWGHPGQADADPTSGPTLRPSA